MLDIMIDLETMSTKPNAAIIAIGAVEFDQNGIGERFYAKVSLQSSVESGGVIDPATVLWWMQQSDSARSEFSRPAYHIVNALLDFQDWMAERGTFDELRVWGNGAAFDNVILASAYDRSTLSRPWQFWNDRCYRTMKNLYPHVELKRTGTHHNAVNDAESQAEHLVAILAASKH